MKLNTLQLLVVLALTAFAGALNAQNPQPTWQWAKPILVEGTDNFTNTLSTITLDSQDNIIAVGQFGQRFSYFNTNENIAFNSTAQDIFITKFDAEGAPQWTKVAGSINGVDNVTDVVTDGNDNIIVVGNYTQTAIFSNRIQLAASGNSQDMFIAKYNDQGQILWATSAGGSNTDSAMTVAVNSNNEIFVGGYFTEAATFGSNTYDRTEASGEDRQVGFVAKLNANGQYDWVAQAAGPAGSAPTDRIWVVDLDFDNAGNIYAGGVITEVSVDNAEPDFWIGNTSVTLGNPTGPRSSTENLDGFLAKLSPSGSVQTAAYFGEANSNDFVNAMVVEPVNANAYLAGSSSDFTNFDLLSPSGNSISITNAGNFGSGDGFIVKYNLLLNSADPEWVSFSGADQSDQVSDLVLDRNDNVLFVGSARVPNPSTDPLMLTNGAAATGNQPAAAVTSDFRMSTSTGDEIGFIGKLTETGTALWVRANSTQDQSRNFAIEEDNERAYVVAGGFPGGSSIDTSNNWFDYDTLKAGGVYFSRFADRVRPLSVADDNGNLLTNSTPDNYLCVGTDLQVNFRVNEDFDASNNFSVQISDENGNWTESPRTIGSLSSINNNQPISISLPEDLVGIDSSGNNPNFYNLASGEYRMRIVSSSPNFVTQEYKLNPSAPDDLPLVIEKPKVTISALTPRVFCEGGRADLRIDVMSGNDTIDQAEVFNYTWLPAGLATESNNVNNTNGYKTNRAQVYDEDDDQIRATVAWPVIDAGEPDVDLATPTSTNAVCSNIAVDNGVTINKISTEPFPVFSRNFPTLNPEICEGQEIVIEAGDGFISYEWMLDGSPIPGANADTLVASEAGDYKVSVSSACLPADTSVESLTLTLTVLDPPAQPTIDPTAGELIASQAVGYQWLLNGDSIAGATSRTWVPIVPGSYQVVVFDNNNCTSVSEPYQVGVSRNELEGEAFISVFPNPASSIINVQGEFANQADVQIQVISLTGQLVRSEVLNNQAEGFDTQINVADLAEGLYFTRVTVGDRVFTNKFIKN